MPLAKKNLDSLGWNKKKKFHVDRDYFDRFTGMTSLTDAVKTFDGVAPLELWKDNEGNYYWATCATLTDKEINEKKRVILTFNQVLLIPDVKAEFNAWKKKKTDEPPKKLCGLRTPKCVIESLDKEKKPSAPVTPKKEVDEAKEVAKGKKKNSADTRPAAVLSKQSAAALAGMDIDDANFDIGQKLDFESFSTPSCPELDTAKEYSVHLQMLHLMSIFEDQENQNEALVERINTWVTNYRQSDTGTAKLTLSKWSKCSDPDFKNLLAGFGMAVLSTYKNKVINPFVNSVNEKLKEYVTLYKELQSKIKSNQAFVNQLKADKERLVDDLQSMLAKNRELETELAEKKAEVASLYQQLKERKEEEENKEDNDIVSVINDPAQTVISSSGGFRKRDEPSPSKNKSSSVSDMEMVSSKRPNKSSSSVIDSDDDDELPTKPMAKNNKAPLVIDSDGDDDDLFSKPAKSTGKKRTFDDEEEESTPTPKKKAVRSTPKAKPAIDSDDEDDAFSKPSVNSLTPKSAANVSKIIMSMNFDSDEEEQSKPVAKPSGKPKTNSMKHLFPEDDE